MTWVIGASSLFGYGALIADIQVRLANGTRLDLLRKIHLVGPTIGLGFAGSVKLGFDLVDDLTARLALTAEESARSAWDPVKVAGWWAPEAAQIFRDATSEEKKLGSQILLMGTSPNVDLGTGPFAARTHLIRLASPDFRPMFMRPGFNACHIGTGSRVGVYKRHIRARMRATNFHLQLAVAGPGSWAGVLAHDIGLLIEQHSDEGISPHLHVLLCGRRWASCQNNDGGRFTDKGHIEFKMPVVANSYREFQACCRERSTRATAAFA